MVEMDALDDENAAAWGLFRRVLTRFAVDTRAIGPVLLRMLEGTDPADLADLMTRLSILYDVYYPPPKRPAKPSHGA